MYRYSEAAAKREAVTAALAKANQVRDAMLSKLNATAARKAKVMMDAALAGRNVTKISAKLDAADATDACTQMCSKMKVNSSLVSCEAAVRASRRRRGLLAIAGYDVNVMGMVVCRFARRPLASPVRVNQWHGFISSSSNRCSWFVGQTLAMANPATVDTASASAALITAGLTPTTATVDPLVELAAIPGVNASDVAAVRTEAAAVSTAEAAVRG
jgi:hypothetical protein